MEFQYYYFEEVETEKSFLIHTESKAEALKIAENIELEIMIKNKIKTKIIFFGCIPDEDALKSELEIFEGEY